ncbi:MAG: glycosyltransferase family 4 protein [Rhodobacteraceae bacterium]|nr:glycosyltransferase family 4 protein [Paracoccaceae bacterium]
MTAIAFYAPLKPPDHPRPSGDRTMARGLMAALRHAGWPVVLASRLRTREAKGEAATQRRLLDAAEAEIARLTAELRGRVALWVSYHNYYKAPDLVGPAVCDALGLPYVLIESSRARKRLTGPWAGFAARAEAASDRAATIFYLTAHDRETLERDRPAHQQLVHLPPFLPRSDLPPRATGAAILSAGMMRAGDKMASYRILADALAQIETPAAQLEIAGDGPERAGVERLFAPFAGRVRFLGQLDRARMDAAYERAGLFFWPGVNEAYGMVYLEAQAAGLPVVAQDRPGVRDVLCAGTHPRPEAGAAALAARIDGLLRDAPRRRAEGCAARTAIARNHLLPAAAARLDGVLKRLATRGAA